MRGKCRSSARSYIKKSPASYIAATIVVAIKTATERLALNSMWYSRPDLNNDYVCLNSVCLSVCNLGDNFLVRDTEMNA
jgi:hypothetical protein